MSAPSANWRAYFRQNHRFYTNMDVFEDLSWMVDRMPRRPDSTLDRTLPSHANWYVPSEAHAVALVLLKIKVRLDLERLLLLDRTLASRLPMELIDLVRSHLPRSDILAGFEQLIRPNAAKALRYRVKKLDFQIKQLARSITARNGWLWPALLQPDTFFRPLPDAWMVEYRQQPPRSWSKPMKNTVERTLETRAIMLRCLSLDAWMQTPGAIAKIGALYARDGLGWKQWSPKRGLVYLSLEKNCDSAVLATERHSENIQLTPWSKTYRNWHFPMVPWSCTEDTAAETQTGTESSGLKTRKAKAKHEGRGRRLPASRRW